MVRCPRCDRENGLLDVYCKFCGMRLDPWKLRRWNLMKSSEKLLLFTGVLATVSSFLLTYYISGGGLNGTSYALSSASEVLFMFGNITILTVAVLNYRRHRKVVALQQAADAREKWLATSSLESPKTTDLHGGVKDPVLRRATIELEGYKRMWGGLAFIDMFMFIVVIAFWEPVHGVSVSSASPSLEAFLLIMYGYLLVVSVVFIMYPSGRKVREIVSRWRTDDVALLPLYAEGKTYGPRGFLISLCLGLIAIYVAQDIAFVLLLVTSVEENVAYLRPYCFLLFVLSVGCTVLHRLHAIKAVGSALKKGGEV